MSASLDDIYSLLKDVQAEVQRSRFGFQNISRGRRTIYIGREQFNQSPWYFWLGGDLQKREEILEDSFVAYVVGVEVFSEREYKGKDLIKLTVYLNTPVGNYRLQSGWSDVDPSKTTVASRGLICALACLQPDHFRQPITIRCTGGTDEPKAVFLNLMIGDKSVFFDRPSNDDWPSVQQGILQTVIDNVSSVWGDAAQYRSKRDDEGEPTAPSAVKAVPVAPATHTPRPPSPAQAPKMGNQELIVKIGQEQGIEQKSLIDLVQMSMSKLGKAPATKVNSLGPEEFITLLDYFLIAWANTIHVEGVEGQPEPLFLNDEATTKYEHMLTMYEAKTPFQRYTGWNTTIASMLA